MTNFPFLSIISFLPTLGAILILLLPKDRKAEARLIAAATTGFAMLLSFWTYFTYNFSIGGYQFQEMMPWIPVLGASYHVGANGISMPMVLLTGVVSFTGVLISWGVEDRPREFFAFLLLLVTGVYGVFVSLDLLLLSFFYELAVFPMYLLIAIWGWKVSRKYAAMKLTLYLLIGSLISLVGILAMYYASGLNTFDILVLETAKFSPEFQRIWFMPIFLGFAVLAGIWPFHSWSPDGHVAAPTAVSMLHAGVLMKVGAYAALRVGIMLLPEGAQMWMPFVIFLTVVNVVYGAFIALVQTDFKYVIGFSSVSHMGMVSMGFATLNAVGMSGAALQMFSHGVMTALFFAVVGMVYDRTHTRQIPELGGLAKVLPLPAVAFIIGGFVSMGLPGFSGFWAEFQIFSGLWKAGSLTWQLPAPAAPAAPLTPPFLAGLGGVASWWTNSLIPWWNTSFAAGWQTFFGWWPAMGSQTWWYPWIGVLSVLGVLVTAAYVLRVVRNVFFGPLSKAEYAELPPINALDKFSIVFLSAILIVIGLFPTVIMNMISSGVQSVLTLLGGA